MAKPGDLIGLPGQGTHSRSASPNNWQSDEAVDVWLYAGTRIEAVRAGVVSRQYGYGLLATTGRFAGYRLHIEHPNGMVSFYHHLRSLVAKPGQRVAAGQLLGYSGIANGSPHLHFAVTPPFDPRVFYRDAYNLRGREPFKPGVTPEAPAPLPIPGPRASNADAAEAWQRVSNALGYTWPAAVKNVRELRAGMIRDVGL